MPLMSFLFLFRWHGGTANLRQLFAPALRRAVNPLLLHAATQLDVMFERVPKKTPPRGLLSDEPRLANGWFRKLCCKNSEGGGQYHSSTAFLKCRVMRLCN